MLYNMLYENNANNVYNAVITNKTLHYLSIETNQEIGYISTVDDDLNLYTLHYITEINQQIQPSKFDPRQFFLKNIKTGYDDCEDLSLTNIDINNIEKIADYKTPDYKLTKSIDEIEKMNKIRADKHALERAKRTKRIINEDDSLTEEEKQAMLKEFEQNGCVAQSATKVTENNQHITELKQKGKELTDEEIIELKLTSTTYRKTTKRKQ
jgi:hypothetical protein